MKVSVLYLAGLLALNLAGCSDSSRDMASPHKPGSATVIAQDGRQETVDFNQQIRPILSDKCYKCHGPDSDNTDSDLRLDTPEGMVADLGGYQAVVPGDPFTSELVKRITHPDPEERMPPKKAHKTLAESDIALLKRWIEEGAEWQGHWSFEPIVKAAIPTVSHPQWVANPIDAFVMSRLDKVGLTPSEPAGKTTLIRRVTLDLTGLPPTQEEIDQFVEDDSPQAYEKLVDRLLASDRYGEHRARYWLDLARYADTHGLHIDNYRSVWPYRDWVVNAFNRNMPFDQFTLEQLAGDLLPDATPDQIIATGFSRANPTTSEGGAIDDEYNAIYAQDRVETMAATWLGLTVGCAACHDHKFDPISQKEFYQLTAFFLNTTQKAMDGNVFDTPPFFKVQAPEEYVRLRGITAEAERLAAEYDHLKIRLKDPFLAWQAAGGMVDTEIPIAKSRLGFSALLNDGEGNAIKNGFLGQRLNAKVTGDIDWLKDQQSIAIGVDQDTHIELGDYAKFGLADSFTIGFDLMLPNGLWATDESLARYVVPATLFGRYNSERLGWKVTISTYGLVSLSITAPAGAESFEPNRKFIGSTTKANRLSKEARWYHVVMAYNGTGYSDAVKIYIDGKEATDLTTYSADLSALETTTPEDLPFRIGDVSDKKNESNEIMPAYALRDLRVYRGVLSDEEVNQWFSAAELRQSANRSKLTETQKNLAYQYYLHNVNPESKNVLERLRALEEETFNLRKKSVATLVMKEQVDSRPEAHILIRGQYDNKGDKVTAGTPAVLPALPAGEANRLALARWLIGQDHPLTARVTVNRFWQSVFGRAIAANTGDLGSQGVPPTHPQLLDWLASRFVDSGWDVKQFFKLMVMSSTYRQSSKLSPALHERDPENRLLARASRVRLDAEVIRDQALFHAGLLNTRMGGPPVRPYQPAGIWKAVAYRGSNTENFVQDHGEKLYRRSLYTFIKRTAMPPSMSIFDAASRESTAPARERTNTPLQALVLMNDEQFVEASKALAQRILNTKSANTYETLFQHVVGRRPEKKELAVLSDTYTTLVDQYSQNRQAAETLLNVGEFQPDSALDAVELAAWTILANQLLNLDEVITKH